jgi:hypothetical protein
MPDSIMFDFTAPDVVAQWRSIDDLVMGGKSRSRLSWSDEGRMVFAGTLCGEPGSGFASIRSDAGRFDLDGYRGLMVRVKGDGRRYKLSLRCDADVDAIVYQSAFDTVADRRQTIRLPWSSFVASHHGRVIDSAPALNPARIRSFGFVVADKQVGAFRLEIAGIEAFAGDQP